MKFAPTAIPDVVLVEPRVHEDRRGFFMETWHAQKFAEAGIDASFVQCSHSKSTGGTLRGLHYQVRHAQGKLVRVVVGEVFDVAVDLRRSSPHFGQWVGERLSAENRRMLWVPPGFAHGFYVISGVAEFVYHCTDFYSPEHERTLRWDAPDLAVTWPCPAGSSPIISERDAEGLPLIDAEPYD